MPGSWELPKISEQKAVTDHQCVVCLMEVRGVSKKGGQSVGSSHPLFIGWRIGVQLVHGWLMTLPMEIIHTTMLWSQVPQAASDCGLDLHGAFSARVERKNWSTVVD